MSDSIQKTPPGELESSQRSFRGTHYYRGGIWGSASLVLAAAAASFRFVKFGMSEKPVKTLSNLGFAAAAGAAAMSLIESGRSDDAKEWQRFPDAIKAPTSPGEEKSSKASDDWKSRVDSENPTQARWR